MTNLSQYKPRTLFIEWDSAENGQFFTVFSRVKSLEAAKGIVSKRNGYNIHKATYLDVEGKKHKIHIKR